MKTNIPFFLPLLFGCLMLTCPAQAQRRALSQAEQAFRNKQYYAAAALYKKALPDIHRKEQRARCVFQIAECYRSINATAETELWYAKAIAVKYPDPSCHLYRAEALRKKERYDEAIAEFSTYLQLMPSNPEATLGITSAEVSRKWKDAPSRYRVENMVQLNSAEADFAPCFLDKKRNTLLFTSRRNGTTGGSELDKKTGLVFTDLFYTRIDRKGKWDTPKPLPEPVNSEANEGSCCINTKGDKLYFTRCERNKNKVMRCSILMSTRKGNDGWNEPTPITFGLVDYDRYDFRHPALSPDESVLVFQSDVESLKLDSTQREPNTDLYISRYDVKTQTWSKPENLGPNINTPGKEGFPYIRQDGNLYYSSDGMLGMGGLDIFMAERIAADKWEWSHPVNLKAPLNSAGDDFGIVFEGAKEKGYLSSNREGGKGKDDIWSFDQQPLELGVEGMVTDCDKKIPLEKAIVRLVGSDGQAVEKLTDKAGHYAFTLHEQVSYVLQVYPPERSASKEIAYFNLAETEKKKWSTVGILESVHFQSDFCLQPVPPIDFAFPRVEYGLDSANLRASSKDSLDFLYRLLTDNPHMVIELAAHTDSRGSLKHNLDLSQRRAEACYKYLVEEKKINPRRIVPKGYGQLHVLVTDADIARMSTVQEKEAAHQRNRRTMVRVTGTSFAEPFK